MARKREKSVMLVYEVSIYPLYFIPEMLTYQFPKFIGNEKINYPLTQEWRNRTLRGVGDMQSTDELALYTIKKIREEPGWTKKAIEEYYRRMDRLHGFMERIYKENLTAKSNKGLSSYFEKFRRLYVEMYLWGWVPNAVEGLRNLFSGLLREYVSERISRKSRMNECLSALTTSTKPMIREKEQKGFLRIIGAIISNKNLYAYFSKNSADLITKDLRRKSPKIYEKIERHRRKYAWILFKYEGPEWDTYYLVSLIKDELKKGLNPKAKIEQMGDVKKKLRKKQRTYSKELKIDIDKEYLRLFSIAREFMAVKEHQKDHLFRCYYFLDKLVKEAAARLYLSPKQFRHLTHSEIVGSLASGRADHNLLNKRVEHSVMVLRKGRPLRLYVGVKAQTIAKREFPPLPKTKEFEGQCACPGRTKGKVFIIQETKDMEKMEEGGVLVTTRTNPNLLPAIRKAAAIVADIGGVGSHAAIVSRELNIPCVVGVYNASMILRDGEDIEVDATKGIVRKL